MSPRLEDHINKPRNSTREQALARELRELPESSRFEFIEQVLAHNNVILGLELAKSVLTSKKYFQRLLYHGLEHGDASSIRLWLNCVIPKLGARSVIATLKREVPDKHAAVALTLYWLPSLIDRDPRTQAAFKELTHLASEPKD